MVKSLIKYTKIYGKLIKFAVMQETTYRVSFFLEIFVEAAYITVTLFGVGILFWNVPQIAGWELPQVLVLMGIYAIFTEVVLGLAFIFNLRELPKLVNKGTLDLILVKPLNSQFAVSLWRPYFALLPSLLPGLVEIYFGFKLGHFTLNPIFIPPFLIIFSSGLIIAYSIGMIISTLSVWLTNIPAAALAENILSMTRIPYSALGKPLRIVFLIIIPLTFMVSFPAQTLMGDFRWWWPVTAVILAVIFLKTSNLFWNFALKYYSGASA